METGWTFSPSGIEAELAGLLSFLAAILCGMLVFPIFAILLSRRARLPHIVETVIPATMITTVSAYGLLDSLTLLLTFPTSIDAVTGPLSAFCCFAAVALGLDGRAPILWRLVAGIVLLAVMGPFLQRIF